MCIVYDISKQLAAQLQSKNPKLVRDYKDKTYIELNNQSGHIDFYGI